jgi:cobalamin biosynthesis protein CobD/CbiB
MNNLKNNIQYLFATVVCIEGLLNLFWGNDFGFGVFLILLSTLYIPAFQSLFTKYTGYSIPNWLKILVALFIIWSTMAVGAVAEGYVL